MVVVSSESKAKRILGIRFASAGYTEASFVVFTSEHRDEDLGNIQSALGDENVRLMMADFSEAELNEAIGLATADWIEGTTRRKWADP